MTPPPPPSMPGIQKAATAPKAKTNTSGGSGSSGSKKPFVRPFEDDFKTFKTSSSSNDSSNPPSWSGCNGRPPATAAVPPAPPTAADPSNSVRKSGEIGITRVDADSSKDSTAGAESKKAQDGADKEMVSVTKKSSARVEEGKKHQDFLPEGSGGGHLMSREKLKYLRYFRLITHRKKNGKKGNKKNKKCLYHKFLLRPQVATSRSLAERRQQQQQQEENVPALRLLR